MATTPQRDSEPPPTAPPHAWRAWIRELIDTGQFTGRTHSWVCGRNGYFLKIPRVHGKLETDLSDATAEAEREYRLTRKLAERIDDMVDVPLCLIDACIVKSRLHGPDLWRLAYREGGTPQVRAGIFQGLVLAARLHRLHPAAISDLPMRDYANDPHLPAPRRLSDRLRQRPRTIVIDSFEVRNFKQSLADGAWKFFDPHAIALGVPEDLFSRYVMSLLMIHWGRHAYCRIWTHFDYRELVRAYEAARGEALDNELLAYTFRRHVAKRRYNARRATRNLPWLRRVAARAYEELYFWQIGRWGGRHGL